MKVCFIGHRQIENLELVREKLKIIVLTLVEKGADTFLFGSNSQFNDLSLEIVTELKVEHPSIKRIYVRSSFQFISKEYERYLLQNYDETYFPNNTINAGRLSYVKRNCELIDNSTYCVFYYNENYSPKENKQKNKMLVSKVKTSGTKIAYNYAIKRNKKIINVFNNIKKR